MATIKITELNDIGNAISPSTLVPVVNMTGTPETEKANLQLVGNLILSGAGTANFVAATMAISSETVTNAAQPNITSVGTLTSLAVSGTISTANITSGNANLGNAVVANYFIGDGSLLTGIDATYSNVNVAEFLPTYTGNVSAEYFIGNGSLLTGIAASYGNSNVAVYLPTYGGDIGANTVTANLFVGSGANLTNIPAANLVGNVPNANFASYANLAEHITVDSVNNNFSYHMAFLSNPGDTHLYMDADDNLQYNPSSGLLTVTRVDAGYVVSDLQFSSGYTGANVVGSVGSASFADVANSVTLANVSGAGNVAALNLDGNSSNVLYGNGQWGPGVIGGAGFGFNYYVNTSNANSIGSMTPSSNTATGVTYIDFNPVDDNGVDLDTTMTFFTGKYVNVTLNEQTNSAISATYNIGQVTPVLTSYNGYKAVYTRQWGDDPAISKIAIFKENSSATTLTYPDTNNDTFTVNLSTTVGTVSDQVALIVLWTLDDASAPTTAQLRGYLELFVDTVLLPAVDIGDVRTNFYNNINGLTDVISSWGVDPFNFEFYTNGVGSIYTGITQSASTGAGTGFTANIIISGDGGYTIRSFTGGADYQVGDTIIFDGTLFNGDIAVNALSLTVTSVDGPGGVLEFTNMIGTNAGIWPDYGVSDGGSDQYDDGNFLQTSQTYKLPYSNGIVQNTNGFGSNEWFVGYAYGQFILVGDNTGDQISSFGTYGETGADGDGERETGNLSPVEYYRMSVNSLLAYNNSVEFSIESEWNVVFDIAGARTNGVEFSQTQVRTITTNTGTLRITAADDVTIEPYNTINLNGGEGSPGLNQQGGYVNINAGQGSDAVSSTQADQSAGSGGDININAGTAGYNDGIVSLGGGGGSIYMNAGDTGGDGDGGTIAIRGGDVQGGNGYGGTVSINGGTGSGTGLSGNIFFGSSNHVWTMTSQGTTWFPTLSVDLHNGGVQLAQTLQFGNTGIQSVITGPIPAVDTNADRLIIQGQRGNGQFSEGGDVYFWAGDADTYGGDIKIYAGDADNVSAGYGGYINLTGGTGFNIGGQVEITGGYSVGGSGGYTNLRGGQGRTQGGNVGVYAGYGEAGPGGNITIQGGGSANGLAEYGNVTVISGSSNWVFNNTGNLVLAGGNSIVQSIANSSLDPLNPNVSTMVLTPDSNYGSQALVLDPTAPGHIHLRAPSQSGNIDIPAANIFLGGEDTSFEVTVGVNNYAMIHSGGHDWTFGNDGKLTFPGTPRIDTATNNFEVQAAEAINFEANTVVNIYTDTGNTAYQWQFGDDGNLVIPGAGGGFIKTISNASIGIAAMDNGTNNPAQLMSINVSNGSATSIVSAYASNVAIQTNAAGAINTWSFETNGSLSVPGDLNYGGIASPAPSINGFYNAEFSGNISGGNAIINTKIGYANGSSATQSSSGQSVTINQPTGKVTLASKAWAPGDVELILVNCNKVTTSDFILVQPVGSTNSILFTATAYPNPSVANTFYIWVRSSDTITEAVTVQFFIMNAPVV